jgi:hypothetical protein
VRRFLCGSDFSLVGVVCEIAQRQVPDIRAYLFPEARGKDRPSIDFSRTWEAFLYNLIIERTYAK